MTTQDSLPEPAKSEGGGLGSGAASTPFLGVRFECCGVYQRIYRSRAGDAYVGWCPRCARQVRVPIDPAAGSDARFFRAI